MATLCQGCDNLVISVWGTKIRIGLEGEQDRQFNSGMYAAGSERCPVRLLSICHSVYPTLV